MRNLRNWRNVQNLSSLIIVATLFAGCAATEVQQQVMKIQPGLPDGYYIVSRVVDGDTVELQNVGKLRFADYDAPEMSEPDGPVLKQKLAELVEGKPVYVQFNRRKRDGMPAHGYYGRLIGKILVPVTDQMK